MKLFVNTDEKPATCCCGCSLICGIITYVVFQSIGLVAQLSILNWWGIIGASIFLAPNVWLLMRQDDTTARKVAYIFQCITMGLLLLWILIWFLGILTDWYGAGITETFCG